MEQVDALGLSWVGIAGRNLTGTIPLSCRLICVGGGGGKMESSDQLSGAPPVNEFALWGGARKAVVACDHQVNANAYR